MATRRRDMVESVAWVHIQDFKGASATAKQTLCLLTKSCHLQVICPVTTSLDASPSQTIKQEVCFPRFVISRAHCSCLKVSSQATRAADTSSAACVSLPGAGINPLAQRFRQQKGTSGPLGGTSGCSTPMHLCLTGSRWKLPPRVLVGPWDSFLRQQW